MVVEQPIPQPPHGHTMSKVDFKTISKLFVAKIIKLFTS